MKAGLKLNRLETVALAAFIFWLLAGIIFTCLKLTPASILTWPLPEAIRSFVINCLETGDPVLIFLAFINTHLMAARHWGAERARIWAVKIIVASALMETVGTLTSYPFGAYQYTDHFGPRMGVIPFTIPLAWHVILTNMLFGVRLLRPHLLRYQEALSVAALATLYDFILEPFATQTKHYWIWTQGSIPWTNYVAWFVLSCTMIYFGAPYQTIRLRREIRPWVIVGSTNLLFLISYYL